MTASTATLDRVPPHDYAAEEALLSAIFIDDDVLDEVIPILDPEDFYRFANQKIFSAIVHLAARRTPADLVTVASVLEERNEIEAIGGLTYLAEIADAAPAAINAVHYANIIHGKANLRRIITGSLGIIEHCFNAKGDIDDAIDFAENTIFDVAQKKYGQAFEDVGSLIDKKINDIEENKSREIVGMTTGFKSLDHLISGLKKSNLVILAGRPSMGKTALAMNIARNAAKHAGARVGIFSLEMSKEELITRLMTSEARINANRVNNGNISMEEWERMAETNSQIQPLPIFINDTSSLSTLDIRGFARRLEKEHGLDLIIIDYLQIMNVTRKNDRRDIEISEISRSLKGLAKEFNIPVIALSQLNRLVEQRVEKRPLLSDLRDSGAIEQDADVVMFVYRDEVYNKDAMSRGKAEVIVAKNRNGATGTAHMVFHGTYTRFDEAYNG